MARASSTAQQRNLSLTEDLERLEQSITLTLQEIDHNFSKAHRIVTSSILPIVEQYASHSKDVWEGSKFWKQFFESSANVSLSGYEEQPSSQDIVEETLTEDSNATTHTTLEESQSYETPSAQHISTSSIADLDLSNLSVSPSHSTPRPSKKQAQPAFADYPSPYEALRQEVNNATNLDATTLDQTDLPPHTPGRKAVQDFAMTPQASPVLPRQPASMARPSTTRKKTDPLLHRVLDKTYRIQATPLMSSRFKTNTTTPVTATQTRNALLDSTLSSSPEVAPPELHAEIFNSPERKKPATNNSPRKGLSSAYQSQQQQQRTPGVSVLTPARNKASKYQPPTRTPGVWDSDDEDDFDEATGMPYGASPPKTMLFHIPQSRLLKTPAKEASKRIVNDILKTAGVGRPGQDDTDDLDIDIDLDIDADIDLDMDVDVDVDADEYGARQDENSPSIVRRAAGLEDETF